jgi:hypothetical protein
MRKALLAGLTFVLGLGLSGCGDAVDPASAPGEPDLGRIPDVTSYDDVTFPLDKYRSQPEELRTLQEAQDVAVQRCLARFGIEYTVPERRVVPQVDRPIGVVSAQDAARLGYKSPAAADMKAVDKANAETEPLADVARAVITGTGERTVNGVAVPSGGCAAESLRALANRDPNRENLVVGLAAASYEKAEGDSRVRAVFTRWSECMSAAGYDYRRPMDANNDPAYGTEQAGAEEIATAKADVSCRDQENVSGLWVAVITAYQHEIVADNWDALNQHRNEIERQLAAAGPLLAG